MKKHIVVGMSLLLTLGTAVAGTLMYGQEQSKSGASTFEGVGVPEATTATMIVWRATAASSDYIAPKVPI